MLFHRNTKTMSLLCAALLSIAATAALAEDAPARLNAKYPGLSNGVLQQAQLTDMAEGDLVGINDKIITDQMLTSKIDTLDENKREEALHYAFYVLEGMVTEPIILHTILGTGDAPEDNDKIQELFREYIGKVIDGVTISEEDAKAFYDANTDMFQDTPFDEIKEPLQAHLRNQRQQEAWDEHVRNIGLKTPITVNAAWVAAQNTKVLDNPVDKARASGMPTLAVFSAEWCAACKQVKPVLEKVQEDVAGKANILIINTDENNFLSTRHNVSNIPLLLFYDKDGKEVEQHVGYIAEERLREKLKSLGVS